MKNAIRKLAWALLFLAGAACAGTPAELQDDGIPASTSAATPAAGSIWVGGSATNWLGLPIGANGYVLSVDTGEATKLKWIPAASGSGTVTSIATGNGLSGGTITTTGTIDLRLDATGTLSKTLGAGNNELGVATGGILNTHIGAGAAIGWTKISKTGSSLADFDTRSASDLSSGTLPDARFPATLPAASGVNLTALNATQLTSGTVPDARFPATLPAVSGANLTALNGSNIASGMVAIARGGTGAGTASAAFDALSPLTTQGDLLYYTTTNARLPKGTALQLLRMNAGATAPEWFTVTTPAPVDATYITQTANGTLTNEQALGSLATGILKNTTTTGVLSIAVAGDFPTLNQNTTGSAATLTTPRAIYGNNFDGSAALTQIIASTYGGTGNGFTKFSGATTAEKTYTLPDASTTILTTNYTGALATGIVKNTTTTGALSIAVASDFPTLNQNTTGSAATLTTPRAIYGNNFDGSAALTQVIASTYGGTGNGFAKFSGPATSEKTFTLPNATATILTDNAAVTIAQGGTGQTSQTNAFDALAPTTTQGDMTYFDGTDNVRLPKNTSATRYLSNTGTSNNPAWAQIDVTNGVTGILGFTNGGTNNAFTSFTGPTTSQKVFTLPNASSTILTSNAAVTIAQGGTGQTSATAAFNALDPLILKGDLISHDGTNTVRVAAGSNGLVLVADSSATAGVKWGNSSSTTSKTANYTVAATDNNKVIKCDASGGAFTITLTAAATLGDGFVVTIMKTSADTATSTNAVTIDANSTETINGALTNRLQAQYSFVQLTCDGSNWYVNKASDFIRAYSSTATTITPSGTYVDITSLEVPPGEWELSSATVGLTNGAVATGSVSLYISTDSGSTTTDRIFGDNEVEYGAVTASTVYGLTIPCYRIALTAADTYYAKVTANYTGTSPTNAGTRFSARRTR